MGDGRGDLAEPRRLLVVEDDYFIAADVVEKLVMMGFEVVGPASSVEEAMALIATVEALSGAVLDIHLGEERVFPVAEALSFRKLPFIFLTGYDPDAIPIAYAAVPRCEKPVDGAALGRVLRFVGMV